MENVFFDYRLELDIDDVFRMMGYPGPDRVHAKTSALVEAQVARAHEFLNPWGATRTLAIDHVDGGTVELEDGQQLESERVARILHCADSIAVGMVTAGDEVRQETRRLMAQGAQADALAVDAIGSVVTEGLMKKLDAIIEQRAEADGHGTTIYYGPGYTGWSLSDQEILFSYFSEDDVPIRLNEHMMMEPVKSLMGIIGLTPGGKHAPETVPCQLCDLKNCDMRRVPYRGKSA